MAGSLNKVLLIGRLGADPEIKQMVNGKSVARLSLATSQSWKDKNTGEKKEKTEWHRIVVFNEGLVNVIQQYLKKGAQIYVEGQLTTRKWKDEQSGQDKYSTEIVLQGYNTTLTMLGGGNTGGGIQNDTTKKTSIPEGSHLVKDAMAPIPNPKLGYISASCWSVEYDNPFSLAILKNGKNMIGQKLFAMSPLKNKTIPVEIVSSHYVDPKGERVRS